MPCHLPSDTKIDPREVYEDDSLPPCALCDGDKACEACAEELYGEEADEYNGGYMGEEE